MTVINNSLRRNNLVPHAELPKEKHAFKERDIYIYMSDYEN